MLHSGASISEHKCARQSWLTSGKFLYGLKSQPGKIPDQAGAEEVLTRLSGCRSIHVYSASRYSRKTRRGLIREEEGKYGPAAAGRISAFELDRSVMGANDLLADPKTKSRSRQSLRGEEGFKH